MDVLRFLAILIGTMILGAAFIIGLVTFTILMVGVVLIALYYAFQNFGIVLITIGVLIGLIVLFMIGSELIAYIRSRRSKNVEMDKENI